MSRRTALDHEFVHHIPEHLADGVLYVSVVFATSLHSCCCGCGREVVTPLSPTDWSITFDGESISLCPSVGNRSFECQSHYYIRRNKVNWLPSFAETEPRLRLPFWRRVAQWPFRPPGWLRQLLPPRLY